MSQVVKEEKIRYPPTKKEQIVDDFYGTQVADPYRWLENADAPEVIQWVEAQNALTRDRLDRPERRNLKARLTKLFDFPRYTVPFRRGKFYFYQKNTGLQNQSVLYVQEGLKGKPRVLLDPNTLSPDGTVALTDITASHNGKLMVYGLSSSGSDRQELSVRDVRTRKDLPDKILWVKFASVTWTHDNRSFYYTRFPQPGTVPPGDENYFCKIYLHRLGEDQSRDALIYQRPEDKEVIFGTDITNDDRYLMIGAFKGASDKSEWLVLDRKTQTITPLFTGFSDANNFVEDVDGRFYFRTEKDAPLGRVITIDYKRGNLKPVEIIPEARDKLSAVTVVNRQIVTSYLHNASQRVQIYSLAGKPESDIQLPALGTVTELTGEPDDKEMFLNFESFTYLPSSYRYDFVSRGMEPFFKSEGKVDSSAYETKQIWYSSKDGAKVSMFVVHKKGLQLDGNRPTQLYGYGGFNISLTPAYSPPVFTLLEKGGVFAVPNLRGGGEYGEEWHKAGMLDKKQTVFDDFIAGAEWLIANGYTRPAKLAIRGGSNGGLLVAASMVQRPDLFGAVVCQVPVADMLRYHLFTVGRFWIPDYGSADNPQQFHFLYSYSPYHNVRDGVSYPATLITTADTDDRVFPGMAKKFAARLQEATAGPKPILLRVETKAGHGLGKPVSKLIEEAADIYMFLFWQLGVE
ncbi:MAG TPA: prolyl oligopeptidase family serine peptidase [Acidobacteriota bacterium]|nr:prolyl oligopeptidase family serine peptidase [Acidobacteriota bacterium]